MCLNQFSNFRCQIYPPQPKSTSNPTKKPAAQTTVPTQVPPQQAKQARYHPPQSCTNYPLRLPFEGSTLQAEISGRRISPHGIHEWRVQLPSPHDRKELWIDTQSLHSHIARARKSCKINAPARSPPTLLALKSFNPILPGTKWTIYHECVGTTFSVCLDRPTTNGKKPRESKSCIPSQSRRRLYLRI